MSISPLNNPLTGLTGLLGSLVNGGGQLLQGIDQTKNSFDQQQSIHDVFGDPESLDAQRDANHQGEKFDAALIGLSEKGQEERRLQALANGLESVDNSNTNTKISGDLQVAKGITY